jgi:hypothetical protein
VGLLLGRALGRLSPGLLGVPTELSGSLLEFWGLLTRKPKPGGNSAFPIRTAEIPFGLSARTLRRLLTSRSAEGAAGGGGRRPNALRSLQPASDVEIGGRMRTQSHSLQWRLGSVAEEGVR